MNILHIFSNWKWTGPAEHALNLAFALGKSGHRITFACGSPPDSAPESIADHARRTGVPPVDRFTLNKHFNIFDNIQDIFQLRSFIKKEKFDLIHTHLTNDHFIAGAAARFCSSRIPIVRTCYEGQGLKKTVKNRFLLTTMTDALITISEQTRSQIITTYAIPPEHIWKVHVPVDLSRFNSRVKHNRAQYRLSEDDIVGGIVARVQKHRRYEVILEALVIILREFPQLKFMVIGRGTHIEEIAIKPSMKMGIRGNLIFTGYKSDDYPETLSCLNFKLFLVPGSDGSCRAVREAMALGIPVIAANRGMLPEIVDHDEDGLVIDDTPENLAEAMITLIENPDFRQRLGHNAMKKAQEEFDLICQAKKIEHVYEQVLGRTS